MSQKKRTRASAAIAKNDEITIRLDARISKWVPAVAAFEGVSVETFVNRAIASCAGAIADTSSAYLQELGNEIGRHENPKPAKSEVSRA